MTGPRAACSSGDVAGRCAVGGAVKLPPDEPMPSDVVGHGIFSLKVHDDGVPWGNIFTVYVRPESRRRGIARQLLLEGEAWFRANGRVRMQAATHVTNEKVLALMASLGWSRTGPHRSLWPSWGLEKELGQGR